MQARAATLAYKKVFVTSAPPTRVLDELFVRLLADLERAEDAIRRGDVARKGHLVGHALAILTELVAALDPLASPDLTENLAGLYGFAMSRVSEGSIHLDDKRLAEARAILTPIHEAFRTAIKEAT